MTHSLSSAMQHTLPEWLLICNAADGCTHTCSRPQDAERCMCKRWKSAVEERTNGVRNRLLPGPTHPPLVPWVWGELAHLLLSIHRPWTQAASCLSSPLCIYICMYKGHFTVSVPLQSTMAVLSKNVRTHWRVCCIVTKNAFKKDRNKEHNS